MTPQPFSQLETTFLPLFSQFLTSRGETAEHSTHAAHLVLPLIVAGFAKTATQPQHAPTLTEWLTDSLLSDTTADSATLIAWGKPRLPILLGGNAADVAAELAQQSQLSKTTAGALLALAVPLVFRTLRPLANQHPALLAQLSQQYTWLNQQLNPAMLTALGIGNLYSLMHQLNSMARVV